ncbi:MAG: type II secretion system protein [Lachnospiraceae bacterium]|nr:type II secretion system protein [Lachnospiraceae bacterium]
MKKNKGFSLVELIIVIAIMAILVGVIAPQLIRYIEKANVSADVTTLDSIRSAVTYAASDPEFATSTEALPTSATTYGALAGTILGNIAHNTVDTSGKFKSKNIKGSAVSNVNVEINSDNSKVKVYYDDFTIDEDGTVTTPTNN